MNPEKDQDRVFDSVDHFDRFGFVIFPQNRSIYRHLADRLRDEEILEAGCGIGVGSYILQPDMATDKLERNVSFAKQLYPRTNFDTWDIGKSPFSQKYDFVVAVEVVEHVGNTKAAILNLMDSARKEVWFSTPNNSEETPSNPFHVREYSVPEMYGLLSILPGIEKIEMYHWETFERVGADTDAQQVVYRLIL